MKTLKNVLLILSLLISTEKIYSQNEDQPQLVTYYFVELAPNVEKDSISPSKSQKILNAHLQNIKEMAQQGKLLLAGPFADGGGLFVLDAESREEAESWILQDPAVKANIFNFKLRKWFTE
ncbi:MAG: YciI family protein, partial [Bacteroidota bacterium]